MTAPTPERKVARNQRSPEAQEYQRYYNTKQWRAVRARQLHEHPLCVMCLKVDRITAATVCDHIDPDKGDWLKFLAGPFQSLCAEHHNSTKQQQEKSGYSRDVGADGMPIDPNHPFYR